MFPDNVSPANMISNSLASSSEVSNVAFSNFYPYGIMIAGVFVGVAVILIIIAIAERLFHHTQNVASAPYKGILKPDKNTYMMFETEPFKRRNVNKFNRDY